MLAIRAYKEVKELLEELDPEDQQDLRDNLGPMDLSVNQVLRVYRVELVLLEIQALKVSLDQPEL